MKKTVFIGVIAMFFMNISMFAQTDVNVAVAVSKKYTSCGPATHLGYYYVYSTTEGKYDLRQKAKQIVKRQYGGTATNDYANSGGEDYLVIVSANATSPSGCELHTYGVGFGFSYDQALSKAIKSLKANNWSYKSSDGYKIVKSEQF